ncbi:MULTISPECIES: LysR family transcriptional regulator [Streptomyces]|uniref:LysR family transcriptional regulator n=1 Tax=Streptomyces TaxID=1883 RepID=UPI001933E830|nr:MULTISPECIES: LysR family transcriptional regulator [Streptomyces]
MELEVRHLRALCAIADTGSVRRAARELGVSQPALTTQLRRIEQSLGAELFHRGRDGCRPTLLGRTVLSRARTVVDSMAVLVEEARAEAAALGRPGPRLRVGSTASRIVGDWLRRLRGRMPETDITLQVDVSATVLLRSLRAGRLDLAFVHEVEGSPLRVPDGLVQHTLLEREPQFISLAPDHPAAARPVVDLADLAHDRWMVDPSVDGEWDGVRRVLAAAGIDPPVLHGDYLTTASLVALGEAVAPCQPTSGPRDDMVIRPLRDDPLAVRLLLVTPPRCPAAGPAYEELTGAYRAAALRAGPYREWLEGAPERPGALLGG